MTITQDFFVNVLHAIGDNSCCYLQTSDNRLINTIQQLSNTRMSDHYSDILLNTKNKNALITHVIALGSEVYISRFEILKENQLVFISHDGFKKGVISSSIPLSEEFIVKFVNTKMCVVTDTMTITQDFLISTLTLFKGDNFYCELQSDYNSLIASIRQMEASKIIGDYSASFFLNETNRQILIDNVIRYNSEKYMHHFEIKRENTPLFCSHDGFEIAEIASEIYLPEAFIAKYVRTELCVVWDKIIYPSEQMKYNIKPVRIKF